MAGNTPGIILLLCVVGGAFCSCRLVIVIKERLLGGDTAASVLMENNSDWRIHFFVVTSESWGPRGYGDMLTRLCILARGYSSWGGLVLVGGWVDKCYHSQQWWNIPWSPPCRKSSLAYLNSPAARWFLGTLVLVTPHNFNSLLLCAILITAKGEGGKDL